MAYVDGSQKLVVAGAVASSSPGPFPACGEGVTRHLAFEHDAADLAPIAHRPRKRGRGWGMRSQPRQPTTTLLLVALLLALPVLAHAQAGKVLLELASPVAEPMGMAAEGDHLWISDLTTRTLVKVRAADGAVVATLAAPGNMPTGLAWQNGTLFSADRTEEGLLWRLRPPAGPDLSTIPFYEHAPAGMVHDGRHLWVVDTHKARIHEVDPDDGTTIKSFEAPAGAPTGIGFDGKYLWVADHVTDELYMVDRRDGSVVMTAAAPGKYTSALTIASGAMWLADYQARKLYKLALPGDVPFVEDKERRVHVSFEVTYRARGTGKVVGLVSYLALPREIPGQHLLTELVFDPKPARFEADQWGQRVAVVEVGTLEAGQTRRVRWEADFALYRTRFQIVPEKLETAAATEPGLERWLVDDAKYDLSSPVVAELVEKLTQGKKTRWDKARAIYEHLAKTISYDRSGGWNNAAAVLERGNGSCSEYTFALVALLRKAGIPARYVGAISERGDEASFDDVFHRWAEAYFPGYGWVPIDANAAHGVKPGERGFFFGGRTNRHVVTTIGGGNSKFLEWNYNNSETWKSAGGATLDVQPLGRYRPLAAKSAAAPAAVKK